MKKIINDKKNFIILFLIIIIVFIVYMFLNKNTNNNKLVENESYFKIFGSEELTLQVGDNYIEPGYYAIGINGENLTDSIDVLGNVDTNKAGVYTITYIFQGETKTRTITVLQKDEIDEDKLNFELIGDDNVEVELKSDYNDFGFIATYENENIKDYVEVKNNVNVNLVGSYTIEYVLTYENIEKKLIRIVNVIDSELTIKTSWDQEKYTNNYIDILLQIEGDSFSYLLLPNGEIIYNKVSSYKITENGTYTFIAFNKMNEKFEKKITINQIDKEIDSASCSVNVYRNKSIIQISANDLKSGIKNYQYNNNTYTKTNIDVASRLTNAEVRVIDKLDNIKDITCKVNVIEKEVYGFILIGDSRFASSLGILKYIGSNLRKNDQIIAKGGEGYKWLESTASKKVTKILKENPDKTYYIMTNLGYNDRDKEYLTQRYIDFLNKLAKGDWKGHVLGFISVNPYMSGNPNDSTNTKIKKFNKELKEGLDGYYYCDTYNGIGFSNFKKKNNSRDITHYGKETNIEIYNYIINNCAF